MNGNGIIFAVYATVGIFLAITAVFLGNGTFIRIPFQFITGRMATAGVPILVLLLIIWVTHWDLRSLILYALPVLWVTFRSKQRSVSLFSYVFAGVMISGKVLYWLPNLATLSTQSLVNTVLVFIFAFEGLNNKSRIGAIRAGRISDIGAFVIFFCLAIFFSFLRACVSMMKSYIPPGTTGAPILDRLNCCVQAHVFFTIFLLNMV